MPPKHFVFVLMDTDHRGKFSASITVRCYKVENKDNSKYKHTDNGAQNCPSFPLDENKIQFQINTERHHFYIFV